MVVMLPTQGMFLAVTGSKTSVSLPRRPLGWLKGVPGGLEIVFFTLTPESSMGQALTLSTQGRGDATYSGKIVKTGSLLPSWESGCLLSLESV